MMAKRYYSINGEKLPSVTTIIGVLDKPALVHWSAGCVADYIDAEVARAFGHRKTIIKADLIQIVEGARKNWRKISMDARNIGSMVHQAIEQDVRGAPLVVSECIRLPYEAYLRWKEEHEVRFVESELTVFDAHRKYAGTLDAVAFVDGLRTVIDFKTSKGFYDGYELQVAAYLQAYLSHIPPMKPTAGGILRLDKETGLPEWRVYHGDTLAKATNAFYKLCEFFHAKSEIKKQYLEPEEIKVIGGAK